MKALGEPSAAVLVSVHSVRGSAPREVGAAMVVTPHGLQGSVGGGHLEWQATAHARALLRGEAVPAPVRYALGPSLGQCCGGEVVLEFSLMASQAQAEAALRHSEPAPMPVAVFGAGHVGRALVALLSTLPVAVHWVDSRADAFPNQPHPRVRHELAEPVQDAVPDLQPGSRVVIMTHSHVQDLDLVAACLQRQRERGDLPFIGLIGSASKWASFRQRLLDRGLGDTDLARVACPIGVPGIPGKQPEVIAVSVAAQLLQT